MKAKRKRSGRPGLRFVIISLACLFLSVFGFLGALQVAGTSGWTLGGVSFPSWLGGIVATGSNGQITLSNGTTISATLIPADQISFKMQLVANYLDNSQETIFSKSTLPGLALIKVHNRPVRNVTALAVAAIAVSNPLPSDAQAYFKLNFTATIRRATTGTAACQTTTVGTVCVMPQYTQGLPDLTKWFYREVAAPFVGTNGGLSMAVLPPLTVLGGEVFQDIPSNAQSASRQVDWKLHASVTVTAPGYPQLSLIGDTLSSATFNFDGSITGGCTDCNPPPTSTPTGGAASTTTTTIGGSIKMSAEPETPPEQPPTLTVTTLTVTLSNPVIAATAANPTLKPLIESGPGTNTQATVLSLSVTSEGNIRETVRYGGGQESGKQSTSRVTHETASENWGEEGVGKRYHGAQLEVIPVIAFDTGSQTIYLSQNAIISAIIVAVVLLALILFVLRKQKKL